MKKALLAILGLVSFIGQSEAMMASATFKTAEGQKIQVTIDKKVINTVPRSLVKVESKPGIHQVKIKVFNGPELFVTNEQLKIMGGYRSEFTVYINGSNTLEIKKTGSVKMYHYQYRNPDKFYNRRNYALLKDRKPVQKKHRSTNDITGPSFAKEGVRQKALV